jgi:hypothetical protein
MAGAPVDTTDFRAGEELGAEAFVVSINETIGWNFSCIVINELWTVARPG